jgi:hypothetical protein
MIRSVFRAGHDGSLALLGRQNGVSFKQKAYNMLQHTLYDRTILSIYSQAATATNVCPLYAGAYLA